MPKNPIVLLEVVEYMLSRRVAHTKDLYVRIGNYYLGVTRSTVL
jgi:hypothetical protein